jgi:signal transduction histidine kinase
MVPQRARSRLRAKARSAAWIVAFGVGFFLTARLSQGFIFGKSPMGVVWAPNALLLSALILATRKTWGVVLGAAAAAHVIAMGGITPAWRMAWQIAANALCVVAAAVALRRFIGFPLRFERRREVFIYTAVALMMPALLALIAPAFVLSVASAEATFSPAVAFARVALANTSPLLLVTPVVILCAQIEPRRLRSISTRLAANGAITITAALVISIVVLNAQSGLSRFPWALLLTFPPLVLAGVRLGPTVSSILVLLVAILSVVGAGQQLGPFVSMRADVVLSLQIYWIVIGPPVLLLAAATREQQRVEATLHDQRSQLARATRLATAGELSGALAHELRQPMTSILANAHAGLRLLENDPTDVVVIREILEDIAQQDQQAATIISRTRSLLKGDTVKLESVTLESVVRDALTLTRSTAALAGIHVQARIPPSVTRVRGDHVQLLQVLVNLIVNACESMADVSTPDRVLRIRVEHAGQDRVEVLVGDSGVGLPSNEPERVFETFFTTKDDGLGLGLSIGRSIASVHGGRLWAENNADHGGATFHLELPTFDETLATINN